MFELFFSEVLCVCRFSLNQVNQVMLNLFKFPKLKDVQLLSLQASWTFSEVYYETDRLVYC